MYIRILTCGAAELRPGHFARPLSHVITLNSCDNLLTIDIIIMTGFIQVIIAYRYSGMGVRHCSKHWMDGSAFRRHSEPPRCAEASSPFHRCRN